LNAASRHDRPSDGSPGVILLKTKVDSHSAVALFDTGAEGNFASQSFITRSGLQSWLRPSSRMIKYADGSVKPACGEATLPLRLLTAGKGYDCKITVVVADLQPRFDIVLGTPFCRQHKPRPDWAKMTIDLPEPQRTGTTAWRAALRSEPLPGDGGANGLALSELSVQSFEQLWKRGHIDAETVHCINIRAPRNLNAVQAEDSSEAAELNRLRADLYAKFAAVFPDKLPSVDPETIGTAAPHVDPGTRRAQQAAARVPPVGQAASF
jgi:hypothetical protein